MAYDRITLNNGLRIIGERMEAVHTVAVGVFVRTGAVNEAPAENGYSHFVEHMVFKGTKDKDAAALADEALMARIRAYAASAARPTPSPPRRAPAFTQRSSRRTSAAASAFCRT